MQTCAYVDGNLVLDLCGVSDIQKHIRIPTDPSITMTKPTTTTSETTTSSTVKINSLDYGFNSVQNVFSSSKVLTSIVMALMVDRGLLTYETRIADIWPEFSVENKDDITIEDLLKHESGLQKLQVSFTTKELRRECVKSGKSGISDKSGQNENNSNSNSNSNIDVSLDGIVCVGDTCTLVTSPTTTPTTTVDSSKLSTAIAAAIPKHIARSNKQTLTTSQQADSPLPVPGRSVQPKTRAYHALTRGWIINEIVTRVDTKSRTVGEILREDIGKRLQIEDELIMGGNEAKESIDSRRHTPLVGIRSGWLWSKCLHVWNRNDVSIKHLLIHLLLKNVRTNNIL